MTVAAAKPLTIRDRVIEMRRVPASELRANPKNFRTHPPEQRSALAGVLEQVGIAGALLGRQTAAGVELIDGHLRAEDYGDLAWPVLILDVDDAEADLLLASHDPIGAMAKADGEALAALLEGLTAESEGLQTLLDQLGQDAIQLQLEALAAAEMDAPTPDDAPTGERCRMISFPMTEQQEKTCRAAIELGKTVFNLNATGDVVSRILGDWLDAKNQQEGGS